VTARELEPSIDSMVCFALYSASRATTQAYRTLLEPFGLTYPQYLVLVLLWARDGRSVSELGAELDLDSGTLSPLLRRMTDAGFVERARDTADERVVRIALTDRGRAAQQDLAHVPTCIAEGTGLATLDAARALIDQLERLTAGMHAATHDH
jgi:MarR family transcriptional regulator, organic hydroperoxide resistance regulator